MKVGIIGAGFAGVAAAKQIAQAGVAVSLFSAEEVLPYYRPRLPELAFGEELSNDIFINESDWYAANGIELRLNTRVKSFNGDFEVFWGEDSCEKFDALVIATGAAPVVASFCEENQDASVCHLWNHSDAFKIRNCLKSSKQLIVIGGGLVGIESALRTAKNGLSVTIVARERLMGRHFGEKASEIIEAKLRARDISIVFNDNVLKLDKSGDVTELFMESGKKWNCDFVILAIGAAFDNSMAIKAGLATDRRILVNEKLQTSLLGIFAAGDIAQFSHVTSCSVKEALRQGKVVGQNVLAYLNDSEFEKYEIEPIVLQLKYEDFEMYSVGKVPGPGLREEILELEEMKIYRACIYEDDRLVGIQMLGSNKDFDKYHKRFLAEKAWE